MVQAIPQREKLTRKEAADYLGAEHGIRVMPSTLAKKAVTGGGPAFHKAGSWVFYTKTDLDAYARSITKRVLSTADLHAGAAA